MWMRYNASLSPSRARRTSAKFFMPLPIQPCSFVHPWFLLDPQIADVAEMVEAGRLVVGRADHQACAHDKERYETKARYDKARYEA